MSKYKILNSIWFVLAEGIKIYFTNIDKFLTYMLFPVFGQLIGIALSFGLALGFTDLIVAKVDNPWVAMLLVLLLAVPGLLIFVKAFWDFMVAYVALNSMTEGAISTGKVYDFQSHNEVATRRTFPFVLLLLAVGLLSSLGSSIFFMVPGFVLWIYFILVYQIFTFEPELKTYEIFKRSFQLVKGHWFRTFLLMAILAFFSIYIITQGISVVFDYLNLTDKIYGLFNPISTAMPLEFTNELLTVLKQPVITPDMISEKIYYSILFAIITGLTLPIRSICWTLWYMNLTELELKNHNNNKKSKKSKKNEEEEE